MVGESTKRAFGVESEAHTPARSGSAPCDGPSIPTGSLGHDFGTLRPCRLCAMAAGRSASSEKARDIAKRSVFAVTANGTSFSNVLYRTVLGNSKEVKVK